MTEAATPAATTTEAPATDASLLDTAPVTDTKTTEGAAPVVAETKTAEAVKAEPKADASLLDDEATSEDGKTPEKADGQADATEGKAPETYEAFTFPEGIQVDEAMLAKAAPIFKDAGLSQENAQKLVSFYAETQAQAVAEQAAGFTKLKNDWAAELKADKEFGGDNFAKTIGAAKTLIGKYGDKELLTEMKEWGWANNPRLLKMLARMNADLSEDTLVTADAAHQAKPKSAAEIMWPSMFQKSGE